MDTFDREVVSLPASRNCAQFTLDLFAEPVHALCDPTRPCHAHARPEALLGAGGKQFCTDDWQSIEEYVCDVLLEVFPEIDQEDLRVRACDERASEVEVSVRWWGRPSTLLVCAELDRRIRWNVACADLRLRYGMERFPVALELQLIQCELQRKWSIGPEINFLSEEVANFPRPWEAVIVAGEPLQEHLLRWLDDRLAAFEPGVDEQFTRYQIPYPSMAELEAFLASPDPQLRRAGLMLTGRAHAA